MTSRSGPEEQWRRVRGRQDEEKSGAGVQDPRPSAMRMGEGKARQGKARSKKHDAAIRQKYTVMQCLQKNVTGPKGE